MLLLIAGLIAASLVSSSLPDLIDCLSPLSNSRAILLRSQRYRQNLLLGRRFVPGRRPLAIRY